MKEFVRALIPSEKDNGYLVINEKRYTNCWNFPGGKVETGETCINACKREIFEETSLRIIKLDLVFTSKFLLDREYWLGHYFITRKVQGCINRHEQKSLGFACITLNDIMHHKNTFISAISPVLFGRNSIDGLQVIEKDVVERWRS